MMNVSTQGELIIAKFIDTLTIREDLKPKTLKEYAGDLISLLVGSRLLNTVFEIR